MFEGGTESFALDIIQDRLRNAMPKEIDIPQVWTR